MASALLRAPVLTSIMLSVISSFDVAVLSVISTASIRSLAARVSLKSCGHTLQFEFDAKGSAARSFEMRRYRRHCGPSRNDG